MKELEVIYMGGPTMIINAGAARPRGPFNVTMGTNDAIDTAAEFPQAIIIPLHAEGWSHYTEHNEDLVEAFKILGVDSQLKIFRTGQAYGPDLLMMSMKYNRKELIYVTFHKGLIDYWTTPGEYPLLFAGQRRRLMSLSAAQH